jgi:Ca2+-binding EF-hand superfamily protein
LISLREYRGGSKLKKAAMNFLVKMLDASEISKLREVFLSMDKDGTGMISLNEL